MRFIVTLYITILLMTVGLLSPTSVTAQQPRPTAEAALDSVQSSFFRHVKPRTNLIYWAVATPNLGVEFPIGEAGRWSVGANVGWNAWKTQPFTSHGKLRHVLAALELRRWNRPEHLLPQSLTDVVRRSAFWGVDAVYSHFNAGMMHLPFHLYPSLRDEYRQGDMVAVGLFGGYSWRVSRTLRIEGEAGLGWGYADYKSHDCDGCYRGDGKKGFLVPKLALNVVLDPLKRPAPAVEVAVEPAVPGDSVAGIPEPVAPAPPVEVSAALPQGTTSAADSLARLYPCVANISDYRPYTPDRVLRKEKGMLYVHFPLGKGEIDTLFRDNAETLDRITELSRLIMADDHSELKLIQIVGMASFEGSEAFNQRLSESRAEALRDYIVEAVPGLTPDRFEVVGAGEAWSEFRDQVNDLRGDTRLSDEEINEVLRIIDTEPDLAARERRLRRLNGGATYSKLSDTLLGDQRNSGYVHIYYDNVRGDAVLPQPYKSAK